MLTSLYCWFLLLAQCVPHYLFVITRPLAYGLWRMTYASYALTIISLPLEMYRSFYLFHHSEFIFVLLHLSYVGDEVLV